MERKKVNTNCPVRLSENIVNDIEKICEVLGVNRSEYLRNIIGEKVHADMIKLGLKESEQK